MKNRGLDPVRNVHMLELIGKMVVVVRHDDPSLTGIEGSILDETMKMFLVEFNGKRRMIPKRNGEFRINIEKEGTLSSVTVMGNDILFRPVDRTKRCERKRPSGSKTRNNSPKSSPNEDQ